MKEFFSSFFSSANIIVRAKVLKHSVLCLLLPLRARLLRDAKPCLAFLIKATQIAIAFLIGGSQRPLPLLIIIGGIMTGGTCAPFASPISV